MSEVAACKAIEDRFRLSETERQSLERDGFLRISGAIDPEDSDVIIDYIWKQLPERFDRSDQGTWTGRIKDCCNNLPLYQTKGLVRFKDKHGFAKVPEIRRGTYDNSRLLDILTAAVGRPLERIRVRGLHPNFPMTPWVALNEVLGNRIHGQADGPAWQFLKIPRPPQIPITPHLDAHPFEYSSMLYLDDVDEEAGGLAVWPGSHRLFAHAFESEFHFLPNRAYKRLLQLLQRFRPITIGGRKGDLIVFHNRLLHSNTFNFSRRIRYGLLIDVFGEGWSEKGEGWRDAQDEGVRAQMCSNADLREIDLVRSVIDGYEPDLRSSFFMDHPRLRTVLTKIQQDPVGSFRRKLSAKIRSRVEGDVWLVVSQGGEHKTSFKLDAYGSKEAGQFRVEVNGRNTFQSEAGALVERIELVPGANRIRISGEMKVPHYLRIVRTANPVQDSEVFAVRTMEAGTKEIEVTFDAPVIAAENEPVAVPVPLAGPTATAA